MDRRTFIAGVGGTLALVAAAGTWRVTRMPRSAIAPWKLDPEPPPDVRLDAFRYAILAPNPHNRQPWLIRLEGDDSAILMCDLDKRLPETDPFDRQITIGFGTFIELARIAAAERGVRMGVQAFPEGESQPRLDTRPIARLTFVPAPEIGHDPLFAAILSRRTNREVYDARPPQPGQLTGLTTEGISAKVYGSVPAAVWIVTPGNTRAQQLEAGRLYARANLRATSLGLAMHPMSQALQEYSEMAPLFVAVRRLLGVGDGAHLQMLARLGHAPDVAPAPRWPVERHIVS